MTLKFSLPILHLVSVLDTHQNDLAFVVTDVVIDTDCCADSIKALAFESSSTSRKAVVPFSDCWVTHATDFLFAVIPVTAVSSVLDCATYFTDEPHINGQP